MRRALLAVVVALAIGAGCTLFEDPPDTSCKQDSDCFQAQGETCNTTTKECEVMPDAGTTLQADDERSATADDELLEEQP